MPFLRRWLVGQSTQRWACRCCAGSSDATERAAACRCRCSAAVDVTFAVMTMINGPTDSRLITAGSPEVQVPARCCMSMLTGATCHCTGCAIAVRCKLIRIFLSSFFMPPHGSDAIFEPACVCTVTVEPGSSRVPCADSLQDANVYDGRWSSP